MPVAEYMRLCLTHPQYGYYITRDPLGAGGDFITAPEISQMFGELIGLWMAAVWQQMGAPENVRLIELGPGRGTMMLDALRAAKSGAGISSAAIVLHLVEISPALQAVQQQRLRAARRAGALAHRARRRSRRARASSSPTNSSMRCRCIRRSNRPTAGTSASSTIAPDGKLAIGIARDPLPHFEATLPRGLRQSPDGSIYEWRADTIALEIGTARPQRRRRADHRLWSCLVRTGRNVAGRRRTSFTDPLRAPGEADLTAHVDFVALAQSAESMGARIHGPISQRDLLRRLGIDKRAAALKAHAPYSKATEIDQALSPADRERRAAAWANCSR